MKKVKVEMLITDRTTDIGDFKKEQIINLPYKIAKAAVDSGIAKYNKTKVKKEVLGDGK